MKKSQRSSNLLTGIIEGDRYPKSRRLRTLRRIRAKLPGVPPQRPAGGANGGVQRERS